MGPATASESKYKPHRIGYPPNLRQRLIWPYVYTFALFHAVALLAFVPWFFHWASVIVAVLGFYVFGTLGINLCFHRLLTHSGFKCPKWLEHSLAILGVCCLQDTPARWVAVHRRHHQFSDEPSDPHSPLASFFWGHMGWLLKVNSDLERLDLYEHYAKDILRDRFYFRLERNLMWVWINLAHWLVFFVVGFLIGFLTGSSWRDVLQFGSSLLVWGVFVRTICVWHITWSVKSLAHVWGYRNYETNENSRNNIFVGLLSNGEGWHNNHHAQPRSASHGHKWWELDVTWITILLLKQLGLVWDIVGVNKRMSEKMVVKDF